MATVTYIKESKQSISAMKGLIDYCLQDKKVYSPSIGRRLVSGVNCNGENSFTEFMATKKAYGKTNGINFYQYVQSFAPSENISPDKVHQIGFGFAAKAWKGYEVLVATHCDAEHIHNHFVINSVSYKDGYKLRQDRHTLKKLRKMSDDICERNGLFVLKPYGSDSTKLSSREYRAAEKGQSWKFRLMADINKAMDKSGNREDFISKMKKLGYDITWTDERKYITFTCPNKMKCRDIKLHDEKYLKENIEYELQLRERIAEKQHAEFLDTEELRLHREAGTETVSAYRICYTRGTAERGNESFEASGGISADSLQYDREISDLGGDRQSLSGDTEYRSGVYGRNSFKSETGESKDGSETDIGEQGDGSFFAGERTTGWEDSRRIYFADIENNGQQNREAGTGDFPYAPSDIANRYRHIGGIGSVVGLGIRGILETGSVIEDTVEDPEERRKRIEAQETASNIGAVLGFAIGAVSTIAEHNEDYGEQSDENKFDLKM